jgi:CheY-like chemotaxis protein
MISIMLVDDQASIIAGLKAILSTHEEFVVAETARSGEEALDLLAGLSAMLRPVEPAPEAPHLPDIVLMDIRMPGMGGVVATQRSPS